MILRFVAFCFFLFFFFSRVPFLGQGHPTVMKSLRGKGTRVGSFLAFCGVLMQPWEPPFYHPPFPHSLVTLIARAIFQRQADDGIASADASRSKTSDLPHRGAENRFCMDLGVQFSNIVSWQLKL